MCKETKKQPLVKLECYCGMQWWQKTDATKLFDVVRIDYTSPCCRLTAKHIVTLDS